MTTGAQLAEKVSTLKTKHDFGLAKTSDYLQVAKEVVGFFYAVFKNTPAGKVFGFAKEALEKSTKSILKIEKDVRKTTLGYRLVKDLARIQEETSHDGKNTLEGLKTITKLFKERHAMDSGFYLKNFGLEKEEFNKGMAMREAQIKALLESEDETIKREGEKLLETAMKALNNRLKENLIGSAGEVVAGTVHVVGMLILLASPASELVPTLSEGIKSYEKGANVLQKASDLKFKVDFGMASPRDFLTLGYDVVKQLHEANKMITSGPNEETSIEEVKETPQHESALVGA
jgi:hypothetical protein